MQKNMNSLGSDKENEDKRKELSAQKFGEEIQRLRERADLSQEGLGVLTGDKQGVISRIEKAKYGVTLDLVYRLAVALNDDPYRLASIYWDSYSSAYVDSSKNLLDTIWQLLSEHYITANNIKPNQFSTPKLLPFNPTPVTDNQVDEMINKVMEENPNPSSTTSDTPEDIESN